MDIIKRKFSVCGYGLLFLVGVFFGSIGMFYKSFDITRHILDTPQSYIWSESEKQYIPFQNTRFTPSTKSPSSVQLVLILTYMRSGSSFTGDIIQHHQDAFYSFEPLITLFADKSLTFLNGTRRNYTSEGVIKEGMKILERWYSCDLYDIDVKTLKHIFMSFAIHTNAYYNCIGKTQRKTKLIKCMPKLIEECQKSKLRVIKTIRVNAKDIKEYFKKFPNFKMIHLVRDPRGVQNSRIKVDQKKYGKKMLPLTVRDLCQMMAADMNITLQLAKEFPNRVTVLHYEDLAENPYSTTARLYNFLDLSVTLEIYGYIYHITAAGTSKERAYGISRSNSTSTANRWKKDLRYSEIKIIDSICKSYYPVLGYLPVTNPNVLNNTSSFATRVQDVKIPLK